MSPLPHEITIRKAIVTDVAAIIDLIFDIWVHEYHFKINREDFPDLQKIEKHYAPPKGLFLVALQENTIVGTIAYDQLSQNNFVLKRMFVNKNSRGQGIAQLLLNKLLEQLTTAYPKTLVSLFLSTKEDLAFAAKKFYLKNGFQIISRSELPQEFPFFYEDDLFMIKECCFLESTILSL